MCGGFSSPNDRFKQNEKVSGLVRKDTNQHEMHANTLTEALGALDVPIARIAPFNWDFYMENCIFNLNVVDC